MTRRLLPAITALAAALALPAVALAGPVATDDASYTALGRVFPEPLAACAGAPNCSPYAQGNVNATSFVGQQEFIDAMTYMNTSAAHPEWKRYLEVLPLDGKKGAGGGTTPGNAMFPGDNLPTLEFTPKPSYQSAGLASTSGTVTRNDIYAVRVTDETVPDAGKKRYALSLSIHGIERAGVEGGTRTIESLVTAATAAAGSGTTLTDKILPPGVKADGPTYADVLKKTIIYFTFPNPDGWQRGSISQGGAFFQRYNGNGVDVNRDFPDIGFSFRPYTALSEPESRAISGFLDSVKSTTGSNFAAGDDLHGQPEADALSYTLLPHGSHNYEKDLRIRETAKLINRSTYEGTKWSPIIQDNDKPLGGGVPCVPNPVLGDACSKIYAQTWGSVYDTINYTTSGALGDYFDSSVGLKADGIDNEMSFSHLDKNITFEPNTEQLHVDGNKFLIFAHLARMIDPPTGKFDALGVKGYVPNVRVNREAKDTLPTAPPNTVAQADENKSAVVVAGMDTKIPFEVKRSAPTAGAPGIFNGGFRADVRTTNAQAIGTGMATLTIQCRGCDDHPGVMPSDDTGDEGWVTVQEDFNQSPLYLQAGITAAVNAPEATDRANKPVEWRAVVSGTVTPGPLALRVEFTSGPATLDGDAGGLTPPKLAGYDVANTDFFPALNPYVAAPEEKFDAVDPAKVIAGTESLDRFDSIVLADSFLPGYIAPADGGATGPPTGAKSPDQTFTDPVDTVPGGGSGAAGTFDDFPLTIAPDARNAKLVIDLGWSAPVDDYDLALLGPDGKEVASSGGQPPSTSEQVIVTTPPAGKYTIRVSNFAATVSSYTLKATFTGVAARAAASGRAATVAGSAYTQADYDLWAAKLKSWVADGGNLVLTDGALAGLPAVSSVPASAVTQRKVYAGQVTFAKAGDGTTTLADPLAKNVAQPGARFNAGMRRQTYEPTPLGFAIQDKAGADAANAPQWQVTNAAWTAAGGRIAATTATSSPDAAAADYAATTLGEIPSGKGQIRIAGALLPQPTEAFDHGLGLEPYAPTYTGYILWRNLLDVTPKVRATPTTQSTPSAPTAPSTPSAPDGTVKPLPGSGKAIAVPTGCSAVTGFKRAGVSADGSGLRFGFERAFDRPVNVDVFRTSTGHRVLRERLVARFTDKRAGFAWDGRDRAGRRLGDGTYIVRVTIGFPGGRDTRRFAFARARGRFVTRPNYYRRDTCETLRAFKLERPVFGGAASTPLRISYSVGRTATVLVQVRRGTKVVRAFTTEATRGKTYRLTLPAKGLARGDYTVALKLTAGSATTQASLVSRRI